MVSFNNAGPVVKAYEGIVEMIAEGLLKPGGHIPSKTLAERFGVSRTPVLEALKKLEGEGVVIFRPGNGAWLADPTAREIENLYRVRKELEFLALRECLGAIGATDIIELRRCVSLEKEYLRQGNKAGAFRTGLDFHLELVSRCENKYLVDLIKHSLNTTFLYLLMYERQLGENDGAHPADHRVILDLIERQETDKALEYLGRHIDSAFKSDISG